MWELLALGNVVHAGLVASEVQAVADTMPLLFGMPVAPAPRRRILMLLWTGLAGITADHAHVREVAEMRGPKPRSGWLSSRRRRCRFNRYSA